MRAYLVAALSLATLAAPLSAAEKPSKAGAPARSAVLHLAPDFSIPSPGNKPRTLRSMKGQPVVLFIADSPKNKSFRQQLEKLYRKYSQFAAEKAIFVAAFREGDGPVHSDVPFSVALNGAAVANAYGVTPATAPKSTRLFGKVSAPPMPAIPGIDNTIGGFNAVVIGRDGNIDSQTSTVLSAQRIIDILQNSFERQAETRKTFVH
jgi:hypothetical protein